MECMSHLSAQCHKTQLTREVDSKLMTTICEINTYSLLLLVESEIKKNPNIKSDRVLSNEPHPCPLVLCNRAIDHTVELQWLEHLWDYKNLLETGVVPGIEGLL